MAEEEFTPPEASVVEKTGLAVVHEGEIIAAAAGAAAVTHPLRSAAGDLHYYFPIEVIAVGEISEAARQEIISQVWSELHDALG